MDPNAMADWVYTRCCGDYRRNNVYEHPAYHVAREISDFLRRAERMDLKASDGTRVAGWLVPE